MGNMAAAHSRLSVVVSKDGHCVCSSAFEPPSNGSYYFCPPRAVVLWPLLSVVACKMLSASHLADKIVLSCSKPDKFKYDSYGTALHLPGTLGSCVPRPDTHMVVHLVLILSCLAAQHHEVLPSYHILGHYSPRPKPCPWHATKRNNDRIHSPNAPCTCYCQC